MMRALVILLVCSIMSCKPNLPEPDLNSGTLDVSRYVSFGDSYSAAFLDGALSIEGQTTAYPKLLAQALQKVGGGEFLIPFMRSDTGANWLPPDTALIEAFLRTYSRLHFVRELGCDGTPRIFARQRFPKGEALFDIQGTASPLYVGGPAYNNLAVPGIKTSQLFTEGLGRLSINLDNFNPYYWRFSSNQPILSIAGEADLNPPTFYTIWVGINDVLPFALAGGNHTGFKWAAISELSAFADALSNFVVFVNSLGAQGAIATVPDITAMPFFSTYNPSGLHLDADEASALNQQYVAYSSISFHEGWNAYVISDPDPGVVVRQVKPGEKLLLSIDPDSLLCGGLGSAIPIGEEFVLDSLELPQLQQAILFYNETIKTVAADNGLALVDLNSFFDLFSPGHVEEGLTYSAEWLFGNFFSTDGVHPTPRGQALIANEFIRVLNDAFAARIPLVPLNQARGNLFP